MSKINFFINEIDHTYVYYQKFGTMKMSLTATSAYNNITTLLESEECLLVDLLKEPNLQNALRKRIPFLAEFITAQAGQLVDLALGVETIDGMNAQPLCFTMIVTYVKNFTPYLIDSPQFAEHLNDYLTDNIDIDENCATIFARIIKFAINQTGGSILNRWPDRENFLQKMVNHMDHIAIHSLLEDFTNETRKPVITFLEDNHASEIFLANVSNNVMKTRKLFIYLANMITLAEIDSPLLSAFEDIDKMTELYNLALTTESSLLSGQIFVLLTRLTDQIELEEDGHDEENEDPLYESVVKLGIAKLQDIFNFLKNDTPFSQNKERAVKLILSVLMHNSSVPECVFDYAAHLFSQMFENPTHSIMHTAFLSIFDVLLAETELFEKFLGETNMKVKIEEAFQFRYRINAAYWGVLYDISNKINDSMIGSEEDDDWVVFIEMIINEMRETMDAPFGGSLPDEFGNDDISDDDVDDIFPIGKSQIEQFIEEAA